VVIAALNEEKNIPDCLKSLSDQTRQPNEVVVVDNGSEDNTADIARELGARVLRYPRPDLHFGNIGMVFQTGVEAAEGDVIVTTGADFIHPEDYVEKLERYYLENPRLVLLGGPVYFSNGDPWSDFMLECANWHREFWANMGYPLFWGGNTSFRKNAFVLSDGYKGLAAHGPVEEWMLSLRLSKKGDWKWRNEVYSFTKLADHYRAYFHAIPWSLVPLAGYAGLTVLTGGA
jgi:glycosyltransferase involved in cell wall biosynthesis